VPGTARHSHYLGHYLRTHTGRLARIWKPLLGGIALAVFLLWLISVASVIVFAMRDTRTPASAIVVLGAAQYAGKPSPVLKARLDHAIDLWRGDTTMMLVLTGGTGTGDTTSEAVVGSVYARRHGIPDRMILLETDGRTTSGSMHAIADMLRARKLTAVVLVSDPFHMFRLWILARRHGLWAVTSPTRTSPITMRSMNNLRYIFSESLKAPIAFLIE
jgi:uncharacterized SAM-binding protein YcdF (DUF218 family)